MSVGGRPQVTSGHLEARGQAPVGGASHELQPGVVRVRRARVNHPGREILVRGVGGAPGGQGAIKAVVSSGPRVLHQLRVRGLVTQAPVPQLSVLQQENISRGRLKRF